MKRLQQIFIVLCLGLLAAAGIVSLLLPPRGAVFSEEENRPLADFPVLTAASLFSGDFGTQLEAYCTDHFPLRQRIIALSQKLLDSISLASYGDYTAISQEASEDQAVLAAMEALEEEDAAASRSPSPVTATPAPEPTKFRPAEITAAQPTAAPTPNPWKAAAIPADADRASVTVTMDGETRRITSFNRWELQQGAAILDRYAQALPEGGHVLFAFVPSTYRIRGYIAAENKGAVTSDIAPVLNGLTRENVLCVSGAEILGAAIQRGEYVYFRSDWHTTPYGSHLVVEEMAAQAGKTLLPYEDFRSTTEENFLGTIYRDYPSNALARNADTLVKLSAPYASTFTRYHSTEDSEEMPVLNEKAPANDRYRVYLGGAGGPWSLLRGNPEEEDACLVLSDSYGLVPTVLLSSCYGRVHFCDPRYFSASKMGGKLRDMITRYQIRDIYILVNEKHAFGTDFFTLIDRQLGKEPE